jgi:L,D-peptidoglycan transpeptidase YkuD (ErfK/YbiS/YcfS/YnhG family)
MRRLFLVLVSLCAACAPGTPVARTTIEPTSTPPRTTARATTAPAPARRTSSLVVPGAGSATQAIVVRTPSWDATTGTLEPFEKRNGVWRVAFAATTAHVGYNGFAQSKHEGDGRTPAGVYRLPFAFGTQPDPGTRLPYRRATTNDVWVDDPSSSLYNTWQRGPSDGRWTSAERLYQPAAYAYAVAIAYNTARVPGRGSAIFIHVSLGRPTSGCVSVDEPTLLRLLRWLDPAEHPVIVMGTSSYVDQL